MRDREREKVDREKEKWRKKPKAASSEKQQAEIEKGDPGGLASVCGAWTGGGWSLCRKRTMYPSDWAIQNKFVTLILHLPYIIHK